MYKLPNGKMVYPEDVECVHEPINGKGGIYVGNLEAAENLQTLKSTLFYLSRTRHQGYSHSRKRRFP
jgi:hypothetical protein